MNFDTNNVDSYLIGGRKVLLGRFAGCWAVDIENLCTAGSFHSIGLALEWAAERIRMEEGS